MLDAIAGKILRGEGIFLKRFYGNASNQGAGSKPGKGQMTAMSAHLHKSLAGLGRLIHLPEGGKFDHTRKAGPERRWKILLQPFKHRV
jgi:hypothetical protein